MAYANPGKENEENLIGIQIGFFSNEAGNISLQDIEKQMGKFKKDRFYSACWECRLKSIGFKPPIEEPLDLLLKPAPKE